MSRILLETKERRSLIMSSASTQGPPYLTSQPPPPPPPQSQSGFNLNNKVSPSILIIIIILAIIFLISSLLHLLVRLLLRNPNHRNPNDEMQNVTAFQGQLQQLFHMHDSGVDQSFIESTLPTFHYKAIVGVKDPFDCAVCLCEFEPEDNLRLLPKCSHAFHIDCIDTWLLSHSTCPLCRTCLLSDYNPNVSPMVFVLESQSESSREIVSDRELVRANSHLSAHYDGDDDDDEVSNLHESHRIESNDDGNRKVVMGSEEKVVSVKLGKFKNVGEGVEDRNNNDDDDINSNARRCFSMGSFTYVMDENTSLQVSVRTSQKKKVSKKMYSGSFLDRRAAMSECDCDSRRDFNGFEAFRFLDEAQCNENNGINIVVDHLNNVNTNNAIGCNKSARFSISKIWLRGKKDNKIDANAIDSSARTSSSFRVPTPESKGDNCEGTISTIDRKGVELSFDDEIIRQRCYNILNESEANVPSFGRRTLAWLMGRENKAVQSNSYGNV